MNKIYLLTFIILGCGWGYSHYSKINLKKDLDYVKKEYLNLESKFEGTMQQKMLMEREIEERNEKTLATCERVCQIKKAAENEKDKSGFDWNADISNSAVIKRLQAD